MNRLRRLLMTIGAAVPLLYLVAWPLAPDCANGGSDLMATLLIPLLIPMVVIAVLALLRRPTTPPSARAVWLHVGAAVASIACAVPLVVVAVTRLWLSASGGELGGCLVF